ncbi:MAG: CRISPR-associated endonuclease Cas1 [Planctomycetaceae bacterium]|nr:CRISPR-associated endonuclease Cas1 [Planctomycetaceae bacterium]
MQCQSDVVISHQQAGLIYALLAEANGHSHRQPPALPADLIPEPIEHCRRLIRRHQNWGFGLTLFAPDPNEAQQRLRLLLSGLSALGRQAVRPGVALGGNFHIKEVHDLVAKRILLKGTPPTSIADEHIVAEIEQALPLQRITLRFTTPLRMSRSKKGLAGLRNPRTGRPVKPSYMDHRLFDVEVFLRRVAKRLESSALNVLLPNTAPGQPTLLENHLIWYDVQYSAGEREKHLPGALGDVVISGLSPMQIGQLVHAQYLHIGENTRFGHGRFRIAQLGPDPFACRRTVSLRELAFEPRHLDSAAEQYQLPPGRAGELVTAIRSAKYQPRQVNRIVIPSGQGTRQLAIPHVEDRVLQRAVHSFLAPTLDQVLEASSLAYRRGRHREQAARQIQNAAREGYSWALKADFTNFYDSIDHEQLRQRLRAYLADPALEGLIMQWVRSGSPEPERGLPTGAVISPLLANLFLDEFDEAVTAGGGRLLRYADDFVILFKEREAADQMMQLAEQAASDLKLQLNAEKTSLLDLREPFRFLGYEFFCDENWSHQPSSTVQPLNQLGWRNVADLPPEAVKLTRLPGETDEVLTAPRALALLGPDAAWLDLQGGVLRRRQFVNANPENLVPIERLDHLFVVGFPTLHRDLLRYLARTDTPLLLASDNGLDEVWITSRAIEDAQLVRQQIVCHDNPQWRLEIACQIVAAKIENYAAFAEICEAITEQATLADRLRNVAVLVKGADSVEQLLGFEGIAANAWYGHLSRHSFGRFQFPGRRAPRAHDPLNILLNIGFTSLYHWTSHFLRIHGFAPALGIYHEARSQHAALASDLMEPFRHLVDATLIDTAPTLRKRDFKYDQPGPFPTIIEFSALKRFRAALWQRLQTFHLPSHRKAAVPYLKSLEHQVVTLRRHLLDRQAPFVPFHQIPLLSDQDLPEDP